jgi:catechol 2,3-dioxygenase-like lactoylglutathione lyase family enzyme
MSVFTHVTVGTNDLVKAGEFYDKVFAPLGIKRLVPLGDHGILYGADGPAFGILKPINGEPATYGNGMTIGFAAPSRAAVKAFHEAALAMGGKDEGPVGPRDFTPTAYAGYVRDLDGNKLCAYCFAPE